MDDDEFAELYGSSAVDEPVQRPAPAFTNGVVAAYNVPPTATTKDDFEDLYGQPLGDDVSTSVSTAPQQHSHASTGLSATPFAAAAAAPTGTLKVQQQLQHPVPAAAHPVAASATAAADDDDEDFDILVDDDNGPTPAPAAKTASAVPAASGAAPGGSFPKPPPAAAAAAGTGTPAGRLSGAHLQYVRPGLEGQASLSSSGGQTHMMGAAAHAAAGVLPGGADVVAQRQGSAVSGFGPPAGGGGQQQYSLPLPAVMGQQLPGPPAVPAPRPPAAPYPGPPADPTAAAGGLVHGPRPPPGVPAAPPELNFIPMGQAGFQMAAAWRDVDAAFPSAAGPQQPIKLPRQHNVDKEEYKEFLNLGHGEIFNLDLDRVTTAPWRAAGADISDFFNYGLTEKSWRQYMRQVAKYRAAYTINNKIEILSSEKADDDLEGLPKEIVMAVRAWRQQHPNKGAKNNNNHPHQLLPRARGREYKRVADNSVVLTLIAAEEEQQQQQQTTSVKDKHGVAGEYDGPLAGDVVISGVPDLPPHTIAPPSPRAAVPDRAGPGAVASAGQAAAGQQPQPGGPGAMLQQHVGDYVQQQQQQLPRQLSVRSDSDAGGVNGLQSAGEGQAAATAADMAGAGAGMQQGGVRPGRGIQVKLAARNVVEEQQQQEEPEQQFMDESEMMAEYYNEQLQRQVSAGMLQPGPGPDGMMGDDDDLDDYDLVGYQPGLNQGMAGVRKRHRDHMDAPDMMMSGAAAHQSHLEDLDEFDDFTGMAAAQQQHQQPPPGVFMNQMGTNPAAMTGMGGFAAGMGMPGAAAEVAGLGMTNMSSGPMRVMNAAGPLRMSDGPQPPPAAAAGRISTTVRSAAAGIDWEAETDDLMQQPPQQRQQHHQQQQQRHEAPDWGRDRRDAAAAQRQQQPEAADGYDDQGGFMGADGYDGDGYDGGWRGAGGGAAGPGGQAPLLDDDPEGWGQGLPANACFNCGATDHLARNCPHPKHFNITCHNCGEMGHRAKDCPAPKRPPPGTDQRCFKCGLEGHIARECPNPPRMGPPGPNRRGPGPPHPPFAGPPQPPPPPPRPAGDKAPPPAAAAASKPDGEQFDEGNYSARGGPRSGGCFRCGQEGHIARDCPNPPASPKAEREGMQPPTCYNCGGEGHYARECPTGRPSHRGGEDRWDGGAAPDRGPPPFRPGPGPCFNCGQEGHLARDCPAPPRGGPPPARGPPPLLPPRSVFDRLGGPPRGPGPWDGPPPGRFETPEERAAREAEIDRRLRQAEGFTERERAREVSPGRGPGSGSGRSAGLRDRDQEREREAVKRSSRGVVVDDGPRSGRGRDEEEERRGSKMGSSRERKRGHASRSPERKKEKKDKHSSKREMRERSRSRSPSRDKGSKKSSKHSSRHRSRSHSRSRSRSRGRHRR